MICFGNRLVGSVLMLLMIRFCLEFLEIELLVMCVWLMVISVCFGV